MKRVASGVRTGETKKPRSRKRRVSSADSAGGDAAGYAENDVVSGVL
jgi:hypothetical protein